MRSSSGEVQQEIILKSFLMHFCSMISADLALHPGTEILHPGNEILAYQRVLFAPITGSFDLSLDFSSNAYTLFFYNLHASFCKYLIILLLGYNDARNYVHTCRKLRGS
jgi:hypothetical protein